MAHPASLNLSVEASSLSNFKENLLLTNFVDESRSSKAKVLRAQQLKTYKDSQPQHSQETLKKARKLKCVHFTPKSLIHDGVKEGNKYEVLDFISQGVPVDFNEVQGEGMSLLHHACVYDDYIIAHSLVKQGASVNKQDDFGCSPLHICCMWDSIKCAQMLLANNAATDILDVDGNFAVDLAPPNSNLRATMKKHMLQKLKLDEGQMKQRRNSTQKQMIQDVQQLLKQGLSIDVVSSNRKVSLLHIAVTNGYLTVARLLLENSANVNATDDLMWTPLHCAAKYHQRKMIKLLLSHFANPHALTCNNLLPRDLARDEDVIKDLLNCEDTFLDLEQQKTPVKTKRFSASLLDESGEDEVCENTINITTRRICTSKLCKQDLIKERELLEAKKDQLRKELNRRSTHLSPSPFSTPNSPLRLSQPPRFTFPPPLPPRDDQVSMTSSEPSSGMTPSSSFSTPTSTLTRGRMRKRNTSISSQLRHQQHHTSNMSMGSHVSSCQQQYLASIVTLQRAFRRHLFKISTVDESLKLLEKQVGGCYEQLVMQNAEDIAHSNDHQRTISRNRNPHQRNSWGSVVTIHGGGGVGGATSSGSFKQHRPLSTGAVPPHNTMRVQQAGSGGGGLYRRGDSVCSTDSGVSMMTMDGYSMPGSMVDYHGAHRNNIELVGTIRRCLTEQDKTSSHQQQQQQRVQVHRQQTTPGGMGEQQPPPTSHYSSLQRHHVSTTGTGGHQLQRHQSSAAATSSDHYHHQQPHHHHHHLHHKTAPPVFIPPLTKTVAKIMSTATGMEAPPSEQDAATAHRHHHHQQHTSQPVSSPSSTSAPLHSHYTTMPRHHHNQHLLRHNNNHHQQQQQQHAMTSSNHHQQQQQQQPRSVVGGSAGDLHRTQSSAAASTPTSMARNQRYGTMLSNRSNILREQSMIQALNEQLNISSNSQTRHSWNCEPPTRNHQQQQQHNNSTTNTNNHSPTTPTTTTNGQQQHQNNKHEQQQRARSLSRRTGAPAPLPPPRDPQTRLTSSSTMRKLRTSASVDDNDQLPVVPPPLTLQRHHHQRIRHHTTGNDDDDVMMALPPPPDDFLARSADDVTFPPPPSHLV